MHAANFTQWKTGVLHPESDLTAVAEILSEGAYLATSVQELDEATEICRGLLTHTKPYLVEAAIDALQVLSEERARFWPDTLPK